jgi:hypothetical protein
MTPFSGVIAVSPLLPSSNAVLADCTLLLLAQLQLLLHAFEYSLATEADKHSCGLPAYRLRII